MRLLVYKCIFGGYDRVFPPLLVEKGVDYVIITDDASMQVKGWRTHVVDGQQFATPKAANLRKKIFCQLVAKDVSDMSVSV